MNEKPDKNDQGKITPDERIFQPNISDSNANRNESALKRSGSKSKIFTNVINGVGELKIKVNNNVSEAGTKNDFSNVHKEKISQNNLDATTSDGFKYTNGVDPNEVVNGSCSSSLEPEPSTSSNKMSSDLSDVDGDECSSDTGNDELSCCDDCCIYTYKGDLADLPRSFMNMEHQDNIEAQVRVESRVGSRGSSPEMDFLEMDFDPGPSCDAESDESSANFELKELFEDRNGDNYNFDDPKPCCSTSDLQKKDFAQAPDETRTKLEFQEQRSRLDDPQPCCSKSEVVRCAREIQNNLSHASNGCVIVKNVEIATGDDTVAVPWIPKNPTERTTACAVVQDTKGHHGSNGDLISRTTESVPPSTSDSKINTSSSLYHSTMEKKLVLDKQSSDVVPVSFVEKTMIWTEQEAASKQITQISTSACGATAVINVLRALRLEIPSNEKITERVTTRLRSNNATLSKYLKSRSVAGSTHRDMIVGLDKLTDGNVYSRFFRTHPERYVNLSRWLCYWIKKGAVPIATLNLQRGVGCGGIVPDAWHHQMIFGVGPLGVYLTNPLERVEEGLLWHQLTSDSSLLVRREDVVSRFDFKNSLKELMAIKDARWLRLNVVGQTANIVREHRLKCTTLSRTHLCIPAAYEAGITLAMNVNNPACELLKSSPELPMLGTLL